MKKALLFLSFVLVVLFIPSCNKDKTDCPTCPTGGGNSNCEDIQNVKNFFAFKVGSWWVYEEETSGIRDSVYVTQYQNDPSNYNFDVRVYSTYQDYYYHYWPVFASGAQSCNESGNICKWCVTVERSKYKPGDFVHQGNCFLFVPRIGSYSTTSNPIFPNNKIFVSDVESNFALGNFEFERTVKIHELNTFMEDQQPTNHFFSEDVGLIRKELLDSNQVWNLVNYYIQE